jgi:hypothetical protein
MEVSMKVRDLDGWPPRPAGTYQSTDSAPSGEQAILKEVTGSHHNWVTFVCSFDGKLDTCDLETPDRTDALQLEKILKNNASKSLSEIGEIEIR